MKARKEDFAYNFKEVQSRKVFLLFIACSVVCRHLKLDKPDKFFSFLLLLFIVRRISLIWVGWWLVEDGWN